MKITVKNTLSSDSEILLIPVVQSENSGKIISEIAEKVGLEPSRLISDFKADLKEIQIIYFGKQKVALLGLGKKPRQKEYIYAFRSFFYQQKNKISGSVNIDLRNIEADYFENIANGILLGGYDIQLYKTDKKTDRNFFLNHPKIEICVLEDNIEKAEQSAVLGQAIAETQIRILDLVNAPANKKIPKTLTDFAVESGKKYGFNTMIFDKKQLEELGFDALLSVGQGSNNPPYCIVMEYKPAGENLKKIGLVGKGITFDTGGISIKDSTNMHMMKSDMGGAGAVLGAVELAAKLKLPVHVVGVVPTAENSVDATAVKPGDVIGSYSGKTIEVIDTDAEGRLVLADGLAYLNRNYHPDVIIDLATLTGSVIGTLGYAAAGLFTNNAELADILLKTGQKTGEKLWHLPMWDDYKDDLNSDVADVKNYHGKPIAGAIMGAKFLEVFVENHPSWAHLDIAGVAFMDSEFSSMRSATAYGVRLLTEYLRDLK